MRTVQTLSLRWAHRSFCWFCQAAAQILLLSKAGKSLLYCIYICFYKWNKFKVSICEVNKFSLNKLVQSFNYTMTFLFEPPNDKTNKMTVCPAKTQISLGIRPVWSEPLLCTQWVAKDPSFLHANSKDSDQTGRMPRLIWVFAGHIAILLSWGGSF